MKIVYGSEAREPSRPSAVTVGVFDGVHIGHQALLAELRRIADASDLRVVAVLPDRHPASVVRPEALPKLLTSLVQRLELLEAAGVDLVHVLRFDEERSLQSADDFVSEVLVDCLDAKVHVGGEDFHFGHRRRGDVVAMASLGVDHGIKVVTIPLVHDELAEGPVSSSGIRRLLRERELAAANHLLGRPYEVRGIVEHGDARGRTIGFPTANVAVPGASALPSDGVYAGWYVGPDGVERPSAINIGRRPTFYDENGLLLVEAHLIDFDGDLYGQHASVRVKARLRDEVRFSGIEALTEQLRKDVQHARDVLA